MWLLQITNTQIFRQEHYDTECDARARTEELREEGYCVRLWDCRDPFGKVVEVS